MVQVLERLVLSIVRYFCIAQKQKQKGVADAMIEAVVDIPCIDFMAITAA